jgi:L-glyceraldehyde 3-phosphate reductase
MGIDCVYIFYSHRFDPETPLEETMGALDHAVRQGKALYVGISSYNARRTKEAAAILKRLGTPCLIHQPSYSMINRWIEDDHLLDTLEAEGVGTIVFSPLAQGLLTDKYLDGNIPNGARGTLWPGAWVRGHSQEQRGRILGGLNAIAAARGQSLAQMALAWILQNDALTSVAVGASRVEQIEANVKALDKPEFSGEELAKIDELTQS